MKCLEYRRPCIGKDANRKGVVHQPNPAYLTYASPFQGIAILNHSQGRVRTGSEPFCCLLPTLSPDNCRGFATE